MTGKIDLDEFASFNQQLAGMLKAGLPLEGSLEQLSASMGGGRLREECEALRLDLQSGEKLAEALAKRRLPDLYKRMVTAAASGPGLAATLGMAGDYYSRMAASFARVRVLLVYPIVVILLSLVSSIALVFLFQSMIRMILDGDLGSMSVPTWPLWIPSALLVCAALALFGVICSPLRGWLRFRLSPFREEAVSQFASTAACLLRSGVGLREVVGLLAEMEKKSTAGVEAAVWLKRMEQGLGRFDQIAADGKVFPPLFRWLVVQGGEDIAAGFERAAELYRERALRRQEVMKQMVLPLTTAAAGCFVLGQFAPTLSIIAQALGAFGL